MPQLPWELIQGIMGKITPIIVIALVALLPLLAVTIKK